MRQRSILAYGGVLRNQKWNNNCMNFATTRKQPSKLNACSLRTRTYLQYSDGVCIYVCHSTHKYCTSEQFNLPLRTKMYTNPRSPYDFGSDRPRMPPSATTKTRTPRHRCRRRRRSQVWCGPPEGNDTCLRSRVHRKRSNANASVVFFFSYPAFHFVVSVFCFYFARSCECVVWRVDFLRMLYYMFLFVVLCVFAVVRLV